MTKTLYVLFFIQAFSCFVFSQVVPAENAQLHYRIIGFSFPATEHAQKYTLEIAKGMHMSETTFQKERVVKAEDTVNKIVAEVPSFGAFYTWRVVARSAAGKKVSPFYHFSTLPAGTPGSNCVQLRVVKEAATYKEAHVFVDCARAMYDMCGNMVWFIPNSVTGYNDNSTVTDLKCTPQGTITFLHDSKLYEITYSGKVINTLDPGGHSATDGYKTIMHHDATRLKNGHYMALCNEQVLWRVSERGVEVKHGIDTSGGFQATMFEALNEYDEDGKLVWQYKMSDYVLHSDMMDYRSPDGHYRIDAHVNAFYFDEENKHLYLGCRNFSRILKLQYPEARLLGTFGKPYKGDDDMSNALFCEQHALRYNNGYLYVFNNNRCGRGYSPKLVILKEDSDEQYGVAKVWEYESNVNQLPSASRGGNIIDLPDGAVFASLSMPYNDLIVVDKDKNTIWQTKSERWDHTRKAWVDIGTYRASFVPGTKELQGMIWNGP